MATLTLHLHGSARVVAADGRETVLERRAAALCALAALEPGVTRARAAALLWPGSAKARASLRQQLLRFRQGFGHDLVAGDDTLALAVPCDADSGSGLPLLEGHAYDDCPDFERWLHAQRTDRLQRRVQQAAAALAAAEAAQAWDDAIAQAHALVRLEPASEAHARTLMRLHYLKGDAGQAEAEYRTLAARLLHELGTRPSAETESLALTLRSARLPRAPAPAAAAPPVTVLRPPRLVGRERELRQLCDSVDEGGVVLLEGEPGLGKTRLLAALAAERPALHVQARPGDAGVPYATLARLLRQVMAAAQSELEPPQRQALARVLPEIQPVLPAAGEGQRLLLRAAVERALRSGAAASALLLDDLHFADDASVEMLTAMLGSDPPALRAAVLAQRPGEGGAAARALAAALADAGDRPFRPLPLLPLDVAAMTELVESLGLPELDAVALAPPLVRHTGGNPLYALETLKQGLADGTLRAGRLPTPAGVGALLERRLKQLSPAALTLARVAAIAGIDFGIPLAEAVIGQRAVELTNAWAELEAAQVLRDAAFAHDLVCDAVLRSVPPPMKRHLHGAVADWLAAHGGEPARLAAHWLAAGDGARALPALQQAADRALASMRHAEALDMMERARGVLEAQGESAAETALLLRMAECLQLHADAAAQARVLERMRAIAPDERGLAQARLAEARLAFETAQVETAIGAAQQGLQHAQAAADAELSGRLRTQLALMLADRMRLDEAQAQLDASTEWSRSAGPDGRFLYHFTAGWLALSREDFQQGVSHYERCVDRPEQVAKADDLAQALGNLAVCYAGMGAMRQALVHDERRRAVVVQHGLGGTSTAWLELNAATLLMAVGRWTEALDFLERAGQREAPPDVEMLHLRWATAYHALGQHARVLQHLDRADAAESRYAIVRLSARVLRAQVRRTLGQPPGDAAALFADAHRLADADGRAAARVRAWLAEAEFAPPEPAWAAAQKAIGLARERQLGGLRLAAQTLLVEHALALDRLDVVADEVPLMLTLRETYESHAMYRGRTGLAAWRAMVALGDGRAAALLTQEQAWVRQAAARQVPAAFRESFLERNPVNRALLAAAGGA